MRPALTGGLPLSPEEDGLVYARVIDRGVWGLDPTFGIPGRSFDYQVPSPWQPPCPLAALPVGARAMTKSVPDFECAVTVYWRVPGA